MKFAGVLRIAVPGSSGTVPSKWEKRKQVEGRVEWEVLWWV